MSRFMRGPDVGHYVKTGPVGAGPGTPADPGAPAAPVDQLVSVKGMVAGAADGSTPDAVRLTLGPLDPTSPAPLISVHAIVSTSALDAGLTADQLLAAPGALTGQVAITGAPGSDFDVPVAGVPVGSTFWYTVLEYAC
jgi:hypothetical protein